MAGKTKKEKPTDQEIKAMVDELLTRHGTTGVLPAGKLEEVHRTMRAVAPREPNAQIRAIGMIDRRYEQAIVDAKHAADVAARAAALLDARRRLFRDFIRDVMVAAKIKRFQGDEFGVTLVAGRESLTVTDLDAVSEEFSALKKVADKRAALAAIKDTGVVPAGFDVVVGAPHIMVRL